MKNLIISALLCLPCLASAQEQAQSLADAVRRESPFAYASPEAGAPEPVESAESDQAAENFDFGTEKVSFYDGPVPAVGPGDMYDRQMALRLAGMARRHNRGYFSGWCYSYVADFMELSGIIRRPQWYSLGIGVAAAADFGAWANANPRTLRRSLRLSKIKTPSRTSDLPIGGIVVYPRGVCGFSSRSGHIEVVTAPNWLCSDGCQTMLSSCLSNPSVRSRISVFVPVKSGNQVVAAAGAAGSAVNSAVNSGMETAASAARQVLSLCTKVRGDSETCVYKCKNGGWLTRPAPKPWGLIPARPCGEFIFGVGQ